MRIILLIPFLLASVAAYSQIVIGSDVKIASLNNPDVTISVSGDVVNLSSHTFEVARIHMTLNGTSQALNGNWVISDLRLNGGGYILDGNVTVTNNLDLLSGIIEVPGSSRLTFAGRSLEGSSNSYVNGALTRTNGTPRLYPVGNASLYTPLILTDDAGSDRAIAVTPVAGDPGISFADDPDVEEVLGTFYWEIVTEDSEPVNSRVSLSLTPFTIPEGLEPLVVQRNGTESANLGNSPGNSAEFVASARPVTGTILGVGTTAEVEITIGDLITPFDEAINNKLHIDNITSQQFTDQKVTLLDRYGVFVRSWTGSEVKEDIEYDFSKLSPGNYICVVEYTRNGTKHKKLQMVTIFKG